MSAATLCLIDRERRVHRRGLLRSNRSLQRIAASQAKEMVIGDYFGDNSRSGWTPIQRIEVSAYASRTHSLAAAQNIGWGTGILATPAAMVRGWMLSPPHRRIMLTSDYRDIGVGIAPAAPPRLTEGLSRATYTVEFAARGSHERRGTRPPRAPSSEAGPRAEEIPSTRIAFNPRLSFSRPSLELTSRPVNSRTRSRR